LFNKQPFNLITDSEYVAGIVMRVEASALKEVSNLQLFTLLKALITLINERQHAFFVMHIRSHTALPGFVAEGNRTADLLAMPVLPLPDRLAQARLSHMFFHHNAKGLKRQFDLTIQQAADIISACPDYQRFAIQPPAGRVNP
ncbi:POK6 protein, partial [Semnornis frantzii]|nr:POK6 protein [Semnornis frantzii]